MPFPLAALGAAAAGLVGGIAQNAAQARLSRDQMRFQERMRDTAYQAAVKDLRAAGLNPMLAYSQGGASTPSGSMPDVQNVISPALSNAMQVKRMDQELRLMGAQRLNLLAQERKTARETLWQEREAKNRMNLMKEQEANARRQGSILQQDAEWAKNIGQMGPAAKMLFQILRLLK